ncbi:methionine import system permease protein MetP [Andreesenia angusta]|uniref:Methionine import system permease protein MetP n=1 Tax=Andreesenia angusta TaxID=39480 RepID=A0A1S1V995_9FIRM|nr:methionine ABC transporter permease [Andreesenia angusta]OHW63191.1 methionine import system permease protein MetP [Andreesenia angusta]
MADFLSLDLLLPAIGETLLMVFLSTVMSLAIGLPVGVVLLLTEKGGLWEKPNLSAVLGTVVNIMRSFPFLILMIVIIPFTRLLVGTSTGTMATVVPLTISAIPFVARVVESALREVDHGLVEAAQSMGATTFNIISKVLIPESLPSIVSGITLTIINLIGYSAMAGAIGGGGLGDLAIRYGYHRYEVGIMIISVVVIILLVQVIQMLGNSISIGINNKRK